MSVEKVEGQEKVILQKKNNIYIIITMVFSIFFLILFAIFLGISQVNKNSDKIISGVYIKNIYVSGLNKEQAIKKVTKELDKYMDDSVVLKHGEEYSTEISLEQLNATFDVESAVDVAYNYGKSRNPFKDGFDIIKIMVSNISIDPKLSIDEEGLKAKLSDISSQLPDTIVQSTYYIEGDKLIATKGKKGYMVNSNKMFQILKEDIQKLRFIDTIYELETIEVEPEEIDIEKIHNEIYKEPVNAYYKTNPYTVYPSEDGIDFNIGIEEAKQLINEEHEEYVIPLKIIKPEVTTNMIGEEAFPDLISSFSTTYNARQKDRTTNLKLAAEKINGTVLMPGETFSYNTVVGKRTIDAGYKEAQIYVSGKVVDGLGGGICQVSTTLYNAALFANLEIVERSNHQFIPSYVGAGRDATVVYGAIDFKFKNTRNYPIKIVCSVENGQCNFWLYGLKEQTEYEVQVYANVISRSGTAIKSKTYRTIKLNGQEIKTELLSADTYKVH